MKRIFSKAACLITLWSPLCSAQLSSLCTTSYIPNGAKNVVSLIQKAKLLTDEGAKQDALTEARGQFKNFLSTATSLGTCFSSSSVANGLAGILEARRMDVQVGSSSGSSGSTTLTSSGSVPALLGMAVEYGGVTEAFSGTTATFRTTPAKLIAAMAKTYGPDAPPIDDRTLAALQRLSFSASFDTSRSASAGSKAGTTLLANYQQLSQAGMRILLINDRDPLSAKNWRQIRALSLSSFSENLAARAKLLLTSIGDNGEQIDTAMAAFDGLVANGAAPDQAALENIATDYFESIRKQAVLTTGWQEALNVYVASRLKLAEAQKTLYAKIGKAPTLSLEFDLNRPPSISVSSAATIKPADANSPDLASANLIFAGSLFSADYTLNAQANFFTETHPGMSGNFRDVQLSGKWDIPIGKLPSFIAKGTASFSGLYEHLHQKPLGVGITINDQNVNQPGNIEIFQAKYSILVGDSGVVIPISFTASNRTELIKERDLRGNIGITFDLDKLLFKR